MKLEDVFRDASTDLIVGRIDRAGFVDRLKAGGFVGQEIQAAMAKFEFLMMDGGAWEPNPDGTVTWITGTDA